METPAYLRIADLLRAQINDGTYPPGARLPTLAQLAEAHGVSDIVARRAYLQLTFEGLVEGRRGSGFYVKAPGGGS